MTATEYYSVELIDYSTPGFVSATVTYYGTQEEIMQVLERIKDDRPDLKRAAEEFFSGKGDGIVRVYYGAPEPLIKPMRYIGERNGEEVLFSWVYWNTCGFDYRMAADSVTYNLVYLEKDDGEIVRCVKARFEKLFSRDDDFGDDDMSKYRFRGHPGIIRSSEEDQSVLKKLVFEDAASVYNTLMFSDERFGSLMEAEEDMKRPAEIDYTRFFADVWGDL